MKGIRPLDNDEIRSVSTCFAGTFQVRNRGLFMIGVSTGGRISELLSLEIGGVYQNGSAVSDLLFEKSVCPCQSRRQTRHRRAGELAPGALQKYLTETSTLPVATQFRYCFDAPANSARCLEKSVYRSWLEWKTCDAQPAEVFCTATV